MLFSIFRICLLALLAVIPAFAQELQWLKYAGGTGYDQIASIAADNEGNAYVIVDMAAPASIGGLQLTNSNATITVAKIRPDGTAVWAARMLGTVYGVTLAPHPEGGIVLAGHSIGGVTWLRQATNTTPTAISLFAISPDLSQEAFLARIDSEGAPLFTSTFGGENVQRCTSLAVLPSGEMVASGLFSGSASFGGSVPVLESSDSGLWVARFDRNAQPIWARSIDHVGIVETAKVASDSNGNLYVGGTIYAGVHGQFPNAYAVYDILVAKWSATGEFEWQRTGGGNDADTFHDIGVDSAGNVYVSGAIRTAGGFFVEPVGYFEGQEIRAPYFTAKYDTSGQLQWLKNEDIRAMKVSPDGAFYGTGAILLNRMVGSTSYAANGYFDILAAKWNPDGTPVWSRAVDDGGLNRTGSIAISPDGGVWILGTSETPSGGSFAPPYGLSDVLIARFVSAGPEITKRPEGQVLRTGGTAVFEVAVTNAINPTFTWTRNGALLPEDSRYVGIHSNRLTIAEVGIQDEGEYGLTVQADNGQAISSLARLRIEGLMKFTSIEKVENGPVVLTFAGEDGRIYNVEKSDDLVSWSFLTNGFCRDGQMKVHDRWWSNSASRVYRALTP